MLTSIIAYASGMLNQRVSEPYQKRMSAERGQSLGPRTSVPDRDRHTIGVLLEVVAEETGQL